MGYIAYQAGYTAPQPLAPDDEAAVLQRAFVEAVARLDQIQQQMARAQSPRRVA